MILDINNIIVCAFFGYIRRVFKILQNTGFLSLVFGCTRRDSTILHLRWKILVKEKPVLLHILCSTPVFDVLFMVDTLREKCPKAEFFLIHIFPYLLQIRENTDHKNSIFGYFSSSDSLNVMCQCEVQYVLHVMEWVLLFK